MVSYFEKTAGRAFFAQAHQNTMTHRTETENIKIAHCMQKLSNPFVWYQQISVNWHQSLLCLIVSRQSISCTYMSRIK
jgi:hypothetical protein